MILIILQIPSLFHYSINQLLTKLCLCTVLIKIAFFVIHCERKIKQCQHKLGYDDYRLE